VDVTLRGETFRFVNTHLEAYAPGVRTLQAQELAAAVLADSPARVILVGDLNSLPGTEGHAVLLSAGFGDVWTELDLGDPGFTSPYPELLSDPTLELTERIDYVLVRGPVASLAAAVVGADAADRVDGLWPTDHAGVVATLRLLDPRFFALLP
jgi:endonuclease/exonuclease/phosphatase family metal-dependent hydrolase